MLILIVCVEGESSEPAFIRQHGRCALGQVHPDIEIVEVPLGGNHGHRKIFEIANKKIEELKRSDDSILSLVDSESEIALQKIVICDYDKMEKHGITEDEFRDAAAENGFQPIINKPNFEFFVLTYLTNFEYASKIKPSSYLVEINTAIDVLNKENHSIKGFPESLSIPHYDKNKYTSEKFFSNLLEYNRSELDQRFCTYDPCIRESHYTQMKDFITIVQGYSEENQHNG
jgi:hypothetical protein